jgi:hypothetical protein
MRRLMVRSILAVVVLSFTVAIFYSTTNGKETAAKGEEVSITGQITCTFCKLSKPDMTCPKGCCEGCIKAGDPPLLTDPTGNQYILLTNEHEVPLMTPERYKMLGKTVLVKGVLVKGKGVQVIYVDQMEAK